MFKKLACDKSTYETLHKIQDVDKKTDFFCLETCCDYFDAQMEYFEKGYKWLQEIQPRIQKYRETAATQKIKFESEQKQRQ